MLLRAGYMEYIDMFFSNQDVKFPKPHSEIYLRCMIEAGVNPQECLIVEDSHIGREAATKSGANLLGVKNTKDVNITNITEAIKKADKKHKKPTIKFNVTK